MSRRAGSKPSTWYADDVEADVVDDLDDANAEPVTNVSIVSNDMRTLLDIRPGTTQSSL